MADNDNKRKLSEDEETTNGTHNKRIKIAEPSQSAGVLLFSGLTDYTERNDGKLSKSPSIQWSPFQYESLDGVRIREVSSCPVSFFTLALSEDYKVYSWGMNHKGQLGQGDCKNRRNPTLIESLSGYKAVAIATGRSHALVLTDEGQVFAFGDNGSGQCGVGSKESVVTTPKRVAYSGDPIVRFACGSDFSLVLNENGVIYSFGHPEHGQLGHGSENKEIIARKETYHYEYSPVPITTFKELDPDNGDVTFHGQPTIIDIQCGSNHSCAIDDQARIFTWGFGGYGRLGHNNTQNEMTPRLMKCWHRITGRADGGIVKVYCGAQFNLVQTTVQKCTYYFGQVNLTGEAAMYPKFVDDLQGWNVRSAVCGQRGWSVLADDSVIACQCSPGYGSLAMGEKKKSSAAPLIVTTFKDMNVLCLGLGYMHGVYVVCDETDKDKKAIEKFPVLSFEDNESKDIEPAKGKGAKGKSAAKKPAGRGRAKKK